ncbi:MAG: nucleotidyltransferase domain-containing protein [Coriobacteriales bacterium]|jgi:predicted nucleotidyltransferase|nr:nucleotidyltransferase domain-containing protein [Coriobacteriales bacterium]
MAVDLETVNSVVRNYADDVRRVMPVDRAVLYGSYAKGSATEHSDVDICFFLGSFDGKRRVDVIAELLGLTDKYSDVFIEPIAFPVSELQNDNPFVKEIVRTGREI